MGLPDEKPYELPWMRRCRKDAVERMEKFAKRKREPPALKKKRALLKKLLERVQKLSKEVRDECPHLIEDQEYKEWQNEDTLGNWRGKMQHQIQCKGCGHVLGRWEET